MAKSVLEAGIFQSMVTNATLKGINIVSNTSRLSFINSEAAQSEEVLQISIEPIYLEDAIASDTSGSSQILIDETAALFETTESSIHHEAQTEKPFGKKSDEILSFFSNIDEKLSIMSDRMDDLSTKVDFVMDILKECGHHCAAGILSNAAPYPKVQDKMQLESLEAHLQDQDFKEKWIKWIDINVPCSDCAETRMISMLDLIMSREIQAQCSWTGASRIKGQQNICMMTFHNILAAFQKIGTTPTEIVTRDKLGQFFMKKLKNAAKRISYTGKRRSTQHVCVKRERVKAKASYLDFAADREQDSAASDQEHLAEDFDELIEL